MKNTAKTKNTRIKTLCLDKHFIRCDWNTVIQNDKVQCNIEKHLLDRKTDFQKAIYYHETVSVSPMMRKSIDDNYNELVIESQENLRKNGQLTMDTLIPVKVFADMVSTGKIKTNAKLRRIEIQRNVDVMTPKIASWMIISMLNGLMSVPQIVLYVAPDGFMYPADGQQRTHKITSFVRGEWVIEGTETYIDGFTFDEFPPEIREIFYNIPVRVCISHSSKHDTAYVDFVRLNENRTNLTKGEEFNARYSHFAAYKLIKAFADGEFTRVILKDKKDNRMNYIKDALFTLAPVVLDVDKWTASTSKPAIIEAMMEEVEHNPKQLEKLKVLLQKGGIVDQTMQLIDRCVPRQFMLMFQTNENAGMTPILTRQDLSCYTNGYTPINRKNQFGELNSATTFFSICYAMAKGYHVPMLLNHELSEFLTELEKFCFRFGTRNTAHKQRVLKTMEFVDNFQFGDVAKGA